MQVLIAFDSTHHALRGEQLLLQAGLVIDIIPTPREITASCGLTLSLREADLEQATMLLHQGGVEYRAIYHLTTQQGTKSYRLREET